MHSKRDDLSLRNMSRRRFLLASAVTASLSTELAKANEFAITSAKPKISIGFLGVAHSHFKEKYAVTGENPDFKIVGCSESDASVRRRVDGFAQVDWLGVNELLRECEVIVVEGPVRDHARHATLALNAGRHVHVEKPPAATMKEFEAMVRLARKKHLVLQVGYMWRYNPGMNRAIEAAQAGWLGTVFQIQAEMNTQIDSERRKEWAEFKGGAMFEQGSHLIEAVVRCLGVPRAVRASLQKTQLNDQLADNTIALLIYHGAMGLIASAPLQPNAGPKRFFKVMGSNGTAMVQPLEQPKLWIDLEKPSGPYRGGMQDVPLPSYRRYVGEFADLAAAVRGERPLPQTLQDELNVHATLMRVCDFA